LEVRVRKLGVYRTGGDCVPTDRLTFAYAPNSEEAVLAGVCTPKHGPTTGFNRSRFAAAAWRSSVLTFDVLWLEGQNLREGRLLEQIGLPHRKDPGESERL
jgi:hypothetical protein